MTTGRPVGRSVLLFVLCSLRAKVSPFSDDTAGAPYPAFRAAVREVLLTQFERTSASLGSSVLERVFWENCVASLPCTDRRNACHGIREILNDPVTISILRQEVGNALLPLPIMVVDSAVVAIVTALVIFNGTLPFWLLAVSRLGHCESYFVTMRRLAPTTTL